MEYIAEEHTQERTPGNERIVTSFARFRKYTYVLPSGRKLMIVQYDENDLVRSAA